MTIRICVYKPVSAHISYSKRHFNQCSKGSIVVCPANTVVCSTQRLTCEFNLYFQTVSHYQLCKKKLLLHYQVPALQRYGTLWIYHFPTQRQVTLLCPEYKDQTPRTELPSGVGLLHNTSMCHDSTNDVQIFPELCGANQTELNAPKLYLPDKVPIIADHEIEQLEEIPPTQVQKLDINSRVATLRQTLDIDSRFHIHHASQIQRNKLHWNCYYRLYLYCNETRF